MAVDLILFTSVELTYRVLCYGSSLLVKFSPAVLGVSLGWLCSIVQAQRRLCGQWRACALNRDINRATKHHTFLLIGNGQQERGRAKLKAWSLVWSKRDGRRRHPPVLIIPCEVLFVVCLGSCWPVPIVCVSPDSLHVHSGNLCMVSAQEVNWLSKHLILFSAALTPLQQQFIHL